MDESRPRLCRGGCGHLAQKHGRCLECRDAGRGTRVVNSHIQNAKDRFRESGYSHHSAMGILLPYVEEYCHDNEIDYDIYSISDWGILCVKPTKIKEAKFLAWVHGLCNGGKEKLTLIKVFRAGQIEFNLGQLETFFSKR